MKKRIVLAIALLLGLISSAGAYIMLQAYDGGEPVVQETVQVVVAKDDILPKERITLEDLQMKEVPRELAHFESATAIEQVVGLFAKDLLVAGEQILKPRLIKGFEDYGIVIKIPSGYRAMTIPVTNEVGVSGFIRPGDYIDVLAGFNELIMGKNIAKVVLERILVLATDRQLSEVEREPQDMENITVAVTLEQAEELAMALEHGSVRLALRPIESPKEETVISPRVSVATTKPAPKSTGQKQLSKLSVPPKVAPKPAPKVPVTKTPVKIEKTPQVVEQKEVEPLKSNEPYFIEVIRGTERNLFTVEDE